MIIEYLIKLLCRDTLGKTRTVFTAHSFKSKILGGVLCAARSRPPTLLMLVASGEPVRRSKHVSLITRHGFILTHHLRLVSAGDASYLLFLAGA